MKALLVSLALVFVASVSFGCGAVSAGKDGGDARSGSGGAIGGGDATGAGGDTGSGGATGAGGARGEGGSGGGVVVTGTGGADGRGGAGGRGGGDGRGGAGGRGDGGGGGSIRDAGADRGPQACGRNTCPATQYCCNASCGLCAPQGAVCIQIACTDGGITGDAGACAATPAQDGQCPVAAPHFYRCILAELPPPCVIRNIGDVTNTFCCP